MALPSEKLADSLKQLQQLQNQGIVAIQSSDLSRTHRDRLVKSGFLKNVIKGWYIPTRPDELPGESTSWYASFWRFCTAYLDKRYKKKWCLSPEQSLALHAGNWTVPKQLLVRSPEGNNNLIKLPHDTALIDSKALLPKISQMTELNGIRVYTIPAALVACAPSTFINQATDMQALLMSERDESDVLREILQGGHSSIAGRLAGAFHHCGQKRIAKHILTTMHGLGYDVRETNPFEHTTPTLFNSLVRSPRVMRMNVQWAEMRQSVIELFPSSPGKVRAKKKYVKQVDEAYLNDAYHSLSIEGYQVSSELIKRVQSGQWDPDNQIKDVDHRNALAARGYWQAFQQVRQSIERVLANENPGAVAYEDHAIWYRQLFDPSVTAGILQPGDLAGYRRAQVYIRRSMHVPPSIDAVRELMPAFFELLKNENHPGVRVVLGHFFFVNIHPYMDGNGRIGRFLMNVMLAAGGYPWVVVPVTLRQKYMSSLESASVEQDIRPFTKLIANLLKDLMDGKPQPSVPE